MKTLKRIVGLEMLFVVLVAAGSFFSTAQAASPSCYQESVEAYQYCRLGGGSVSECSLLARNVYLDCLASFSEVPE